MTAYFIFLLMLLGLTFGPALADRGMRERFIEHFLEARKSNIALAVSEGYRVIDISSTASAGRRILWPLARASVVLLAVAVAVQAAAPNWKIISAALFSGLIVVSGRDSRMVLESNEIYEPLRRDSRRQKLANIGGYSIKAFLLFVALLLIDLGMNWFGSDRVDGFAIMAVAMVVVWNCHRLPEVIVKLGQAGDGASDGFGTESRRESVLFLRCFKDDKLRIWSPFAPMGPAHPVPMVSRHRFEELVARCLLAFDLQLVAIGRPNERLPELGALRTYYPDSRWQEAVRITAVRSSAIILVAGRSDGLSWEIQHLRGWGVLDKTIFLLPPEPSIADARARLENLIALLVGDATLPSGWDPTTWVALRFRLGQLEYLVSDGRDWASYAAAIGGHLLELRGTVKSLDHSRTPMASNIGRERLPIVAGMRMALAIDRIGRARDRGDRAGWEAAYQYAESVAHAAGIRGAVAEIRMAYAEDLSENGEPEQAWDIYEEVAAQAKLGFKAFCWRRNTSYITSADIEIGAMSSLADLLLKLPSKDGRATFIKYYEACSRNDRWSHAAEVAREIATHERTHESAEEWFTRAMAAAWRVSDIPAEAFIELSWGKDLLNRNKPDEALYHLRMAQRLYKQQEDSQKCAEAQALVEKAEVASFSIPKSMNRLSRKSREWLAKAMEVAGTSGDGPVEPSHLLLAIELDPEFGRELGIFGNRTPVESHARASRSMYVPSQQIFETGHDGSLSVTTKGLLIDAINRHPKTYRIDPNDILAAIAREIAGEGYGANRPEVIEARQNERIIVKVDSLVESNVTIKAPSISDASQISDVHPAVDLKAEQSQHWDRSSIWDVGWVGTPRPPEPDLRPAGLTDEKPMSPIARRLLVRYLVVIYWVPLGVARPFCLGKMRNLLYSRGYNGLSVVVGAMEMDALTCGSRRSDAEKLARNLLEVDLPGWIDLGGQPATGDEMTDHLLRELGELLYFGDKLAEWVEVERRRVSISTTLRDPNAPTLAATSLAFALAKAGRNIEAAELFSELFLANELPANVCLMGAANALDAGDLQMAQLMVARADSHQEQNYTDALGIKGDIARVAGEFDQCIALYNAGLSKAILLDDHRAQHIFRRRVAMVSSESRTEDTT